MPLWRRDSADEKVTKCHVRGEVALPLSLDKEVEN